MSGRKRGWGNGSVEVYGVDVGVTRDLEEGGRVCGYFCSRFALGRAEDSLGCGLGLGLRWVLGEGALGLFGMVVVVHGLNFH